MEKEIEYLRFDCNCRGAAVQFAAVGVEHMIVKYELHAGGLTMHAGPGPSIKSLSRTNQSSVKVLQRDFGQLRGRGTR
jgi:hypothetical protein